MQSALKPAWLLILLATCSGCASTGQRASPVVCPKPTPPPPSLMKPPDFETKLRQLLFESELSATPRSEGSRPS